MNIDTHVEPPDVGCDHDGYDDSARITVSVIDPAGRYLDAGVQLFDGDATDPQAFADGLLNTALAVAYLRGPDYQWAVVQRFTAYDGSNR